MFQVSIQTLPTTTLAGIAHQGAYLGISRAFDQLVGIAAARNLFAADTRMVGIYRDDPSIVDEENLRSSACISVATDGLLEAPLQRDTVGGGRHAILRFKGPYSDMQSAYQWLFGVWLPNSGEEAADAPVFEEYLNNPRDTSPTELLTDICLPLKSA